MEELTQSDKLICFSGPKGTSDQRSISLFDCIGDYEPLPMSSISEIVDTVNHTPGCLGVLPIENSTDGELTTITDKLIFEASAVKVQAEAVLAESIYAFGVGEPELATVVVSHPQILELCSRFIRERGFKVRHVVSTSEACRLVSLSKDPSEMALAPPAVGLDRSLKVFFESVLDVPELRTRYVLIGQGVPEATSSDRTLLVITPAQDVVGSLSQIASTFALCDVNMTSINSRPLQAKLGFHAFMISCEGHISDRAVSSVFLELLRQGHSVKHLGSFPRWKGTEVTTPFSALPLGSLEQRDLGNSSISRLFGVREHS